jgi:drug/metabolite transporter superfamily protein YnfA
MISIRSRQETGTVALAVVVSAATLAATTHAVLASAAFGLLFIIRFALQPAAGDPLSLRRRAILAILGCSALACFAWVIVTTVSRTRGA